MRIVRLFVVALAILMSACSSEPKAGKVIVLGFDGMDPEALDLLMSEGKMPNFAKLRQEGAYGRLISSKPMLSPIIWTTIATGKTPDQHKIGHFVAVNEKTGEQLPVTSQMRATKALWNIASDAGRKVGVVGWWATWPAETVNGAIVSDHTCYHFLFENGATGSKDTTGTIYPPELAPSLQPMIRRPADVSPQEIAQFVRVSPEEFNQPFHFDDDLSHFKWAYATAESYRAIGKRLWQSERPDLLMVYIEGTDSTSHLFGHLFRAEGLAGELAAQQQRYGKAVEEMYLYADRVLGEYIGMVDDDTTLVVLSDHGFQLGVLPDDPSKTRDMRRVSEKYHRIEGILYLYGNHVKKRRRLDAPKLVDVAPTLLALAGLSPARDMPGRVLTEGLELSAPAREIASYDTGERVLGQAADRSVDPAILERLRALGYLDTESPKGERNLAAVLFQEGRYDESIEAYRKLIETNPDDGGLRASLAGALGAVGRYDESLEQLNRAIELEPLNPEAYHNRGVIYEKRGDKEAAVTEYRTALRYNPQYEPSRQALSRLTGSAQVNAPSSDAERHAAQLAERAGQAARGGDYGGAMKLLDEAERAAPRYALVYQYRSNVAFLMRDVEAAKAALRKALEIEPDNALFKTNLRRLEESGGRAAAPRE
jgi:predicted AlkP superfamily phosphohydrolase/phosphomutase/Flp pilus assembly protein TadD